MPEGDSRIDAEHLARTGEPFEWGAEDGKENAGAARLATLCNNDPAKANRVIDTAIAKAAAGDSYFAGLSPSIMASKINDLRAWASARPRTLPEEPRGRAPGVEATAEASRKEAEHKAEVDRLRASGFRPPAIARPQ